MQKIFCYHSSTFCDIIFPANQGDHHHAASAVSHHLPLFISPGPPDALLGAAWPTMYGEFGVPVSYAGLLSMIIAVGTVVSSLQSDRLTRRLGAGEVTAISDAMTAAAIFSFSISHFFPLLCLWAVPYGLGAGSVNAVPNNYVALHFANRRMSWLHCTWGAGAGIGGELGQHAAHLGPGDDLTAVPRNQGAGHQLVMQPLIAGLQELLLRHPAGDDPRRGERVADCAVLLVESQPVLHQLPAADKAVAAKPGEHSAARRSAQPLYFIARLSGIS